MNLIFAEKRLKKVKATFLGDSADVLMDDIIERA